MIARISAAPAREPTTLPTTCGVWRGAGLPVGFEAPAAVVAAGATPPGLPGLPLAPWVLVAVAVAVAVAPIESDAVVSDENDSVADDESERLMDGNDDGERLVISAVVWDKIGVAVLSVVAFIDEDAITALLIGALVGVSVGDGVVDVVVGIASACAANELAWGKAGTDGTTRLLGNAGTLGTLGSETGATDGSWGTTGSEAAAAGSTGATTDDRI